MMSTARIIIAREPLADGFVGLDLMRSDGTKHSLNPAGRPTGLLAATIGGLGLTGVITRVALELMPIASSNMDVETIPFRNLSEFFALAAESETTHDYTVAWVDCLAKGSTLGRGIFTRARHGNDGQLRVHATAGPSVPLDAPGFLLNRLSLSAFNEIYYRLAGRPRQTTMSVPSVFLSARRDRKLEQALWPSGLLSISKRRSTGRCGSRNGGNAANDRRSRAGILPGGTEDVR